MAKQPCAICGTAYNEGQLLFHDLGQICVGCEAEIAEAKEVHSGVWSALAAGPLICIVATVFMFGICFPGFGKLVVAGTPFLAVLAVLAGVGALRHGYQLSPDQPSMHRILLYASGVLTILWAVPLSLLACGQLLAVVYSMAG